MKKACQNYNIPSGRYFSDTIVPNIYGHLCMKVQPELSATSFISLTTDIWSTTASNTPFLSLKAQWLPTSKIIVSNTISKRRAIPKEVKIYVTVPLLERSKDHLG